MFEYFDLFINDVGTFAISILFVMIILGFRAVISEVRDYQLEEKLKQYDITKKEKDDKK